MREMGRPGPQVNFQFSVKPEGGLKIDGYDVFENGVKIENPPEHEPYKGSASPLQYFASATLYDLFYIGQTLHAPIHVLHYVLTNALKWASEDSNYNRLSNWAVDYNSNVNAKYNAVTAVLIALGGNGLITSANGLGGSDASLPVMKANIEAWGACSTVRLHKEEVYSNQCMYHLPLTTYHLLQATEFHDIWFQSPRRDLEAAGLLTVRSLLSNPNPNPNPNPNLNPNPNQEYFKHTDLCAACAISATAALEKKSSKLDSTEAKLRDYIDLSGAWAPEENGIKTVRSWLGLDSVRVS